MTAAPAPTFDARLYRAALRLCPGEFREEHGGEITVDFDTARAEAAAVGPGAVWMLRLLLGIDLTRTIAVQWLRTGLPAIACLAAGGSLALMAGLASAVRGLTARLRSDIVASEIVGVVLLAVVVVLVIVATIVFNLSLYRPRRTGRR